jgi:hypothetical protein
MKKLHKDRNSKEKHKKASDRDKVYILKDSKDIKTSQHA